MELSQTRHSLGLLTASVFLLINLSLAFSALPQGKKLPYMTSDVKEVAGKSFDYIVVGGGTAGCAVAATLSERFRVLLMERGGSPYGNPFVMNTKYLWYPLLNTDEYTSVAQAFTSKDGVPNVRGRVLGGSSAINGGFYSRASKSFLRKVGLDKELVTDAYKWVESKLVFKPELTSWESAAELGLLEAGILPYNGFSLEHIEGTKMGATVFDERGIRHTAAELLEAGNPEYVTVLLNVTAKNIIFLNDNRSKSRAWGVRFIKSNGSPDETYEAYLSPPQDSGSWGDVILSAGALGSPQILLSSGIGPQQHLRDFNIPIVHDLEGVGQRMQDNPALFLSVDKKPKKRLTDSPQVVGIADDFNLIVQAAIFPVSLNTTRIFVIGKVALPASEGKLELNGTDPRKNPSVQFNYLAKENDLDVCVKLGQLLQQVAGSQSVAMFLGKDYKNEQMSGEDEFRKSCKKNVRTYYHYHGGCTVGSVVDKDYKVYGIKGLRVVDGSTFLESPGTNPMATVLMLGRYQGIKILQERKQAGRSVSSKGHKV